MFAFIRKYFVSMYVDMDHFEYRWLKQKNDKLSNMTTYFKNREYI